MKLSAGCFKLRMSKKAYASVMLGIIMNVAKCQIMLFFKDTIFLAKLKNIANNFTILNFEPKIIWLLH